MNTKENTNTEHTVAATTQTERSDVAKREEAMFALWNERDIFKKSVEKDAPNGEFVFYDGPPFATGLPHYGHLLAGTIKDAIPRFWTMNGYRVKRRWGWDCHGLPLENLIEKKLGLATKRDIEEYGIKKFNEAARGAVMEYANDWKVIIPRMGRFVDMEDDYRTMDPTYTESVWWVFKQLAEKGLVYEGFKSMHICPRCGTTLSNFEVNQGYKDIKDIAVTVKFPLVDEPDTSIMVWTTTPWTLPGNIAAAVNSEIIYVRVAVDRGEAGKEKVILAKERLAQLGDVSYEILEEMSGEVLVGKAYQPPFDYYQKANIEHKENAWKIYAADYVEVGEEGTGIVHLAPAFGDDDLKVAQANNLPIVHHVDEDGHFKPEVVDWAGYLVKPKDDADAEVSHLDTDIEIVRALAAKGVLYRKENITHSYPHCWRCDTPLLNYATTAWFVRVADHVQELLAQNETVNWVPDHVGSGRFGKWLEGARDWNVSRQRYWGAPLPIWRNPATKEYKVFGSLKELQEYVPKSGNSFMIARHGESFFNTMNLLSAHNNDKNGLTDTGKEQVMKLAEEVKAAGGVDYIYYSPLTRAKETAVFVAESLGLDTKYMVEDHRIREMEFGEFEERTVEEYHAFYPGGGADRIVRRPEGGESWGDVKRRTGDFIYDINARHTDARILIVAHDGTLRMLQSAIHGEDVETAGKHIDEHTYNLNNAELREVAFTPMPHNDNFELDYHRPYIDDIDLVDGDIKLERVPDVFDCWFESGSMPYGQNHYPFKNTDRFEPHSNVGYPANFIAEGLDQTRGWFYSLMVLGTALFGKTPYQNVIVNGLVLAEDGKKMSKSLRNYPDPMELVHTQGADAIRYYLLASPVVRAEDLNFSEKGVQDVQRKNIGRLHNVLAMYEEYADGTAPSDTSNVVLDRWMVARIRETALEMTDGFKKYELDKATRPLGQLIDDLSVWYLRRSRDRLKGDDAADKQQALATLRFTLRSIALLMAPSMPFYAEYLWQQIRTDDDAESVHLATWPAIEDVDAELLTVMERVRALVTAGLELRTKAGIKVRQPLALITLPEKIDSTLHSLIADELNVKEVRDGDVLHLDTEISEELKQEGQMREVVRAVQDARKRAELTPRDVIVLTLSEGLNEILTPFMEEVQRTVGAESVTVAEGEDEIVLDGDTYTFAIAKA